MIAKNEEYSSLLKDTDKYFADLIPEKIEIGYDRLNSGIDNRLMDKMARMTKSQGLIRRSIQDTYYDYMILLSDENDISSRDRKKIITIKNRSKCIFIIMVCPNRIMSEEHDASGIPDIIDAKKELSGFPVGVTIEKKFNDNITCYVDLIAKYARVDSIKNKIQKEIDCLEELIEEFAEQSTTEDWDKLYISWCVQSSERIIKKAGEYVNKCSRILSGMEAEYSEYASNCKNEMAEEKYHKEDVGDFAADLLFKYDGIQNKLKQQLLLLQKSKCMADDAFSLTVNSSMDKMNDKPQVSFVGNFSSGKTSFINWLLAMEGNKQLRTSGIHNTAILTFIKKGEREKVVLEYKKKPDLFTWKLLDMEYETEFADVYHGEDNAVVYRVDEVNRIIAYKLRDKEKGKRIVLRNRYDEILVKKNDKLRKGMLLTEGARSHLDIFRDSANVALKGDEEYKEIEKAVKQRKLKNIVMTISYVNKRSIKKRVNADTHTYEISDEKNILSFLSRLRYLGKKFNSRNIRYEDVEKSDFWNTGNVSYLPDDLEYIYNVTMKGECGFEDIEELLTEDNWKKYCGTGKDDERVYTETPEGYLFSSQMTYYLDKGFLDYSDIIDTPGLGSTSEEHDDITERYIRKNVSNLLVMLKIDKNGIAMTKRKFIYEIAKIYEDSGRDKNNVFFVCNLWSKDYGSRDLKELERICDQYFHDVRECNFNENNFYVIDIQKMQAGHHEKMKFGKYQSDECFKESFLKHIADDGIRHQIREINHDMLKLFEKRESYYRELISEMHSNNQKKEERKEILKEVERRIQSFQLSEAFDDIFTKENDALELLKDLSRNISYISKRKEWYKFAESCLNKQSYVDDIDKLDEIGVIETACKDEYEINQTKDKIVDKYFLSLTRLKKCIKEDLSYDDRNPMCKNIEDALSSVHRIGMSHFPFNDLRKRIASQSENFESKIHFIRNADISKRDAKEISEFIDVQIDKCRAENESNYKNMAARVNDIIKAIVSDINRQLRGLSSEPDSEILIGEYIRFIEELKIIKSTWNREICSAAQIKEIV